MITEYIDFKNEFERLKSNQSYIVLRGMEDKYMYHKHLEDVKLAIKGIDLAKEFNDLELLVIIKKKLAKIYISIEEYEGAIDILKQIENISLFGVGFSKVDIYLNYVICERNLSNLEKALYYLDYIKESAFKNKNSKIRWIIEKSKIYIERNLYDEAEKLLLECLNESNKIKEVKLRNEILLNLSKLDIYNKNYESSLKKLKLIEYEFLNNQGLNKRKEICQCFNLVYKGLNDYKNAYVYLERYVNIEKELSIIQSKIISNILNDEKKKIFNRDYKLLYEQNKITYKIGQKIISSINEENIFKVIDKEIMKIIKYDFMQILTYDDEKEEFQYEVTIKENEIVTLDNINLYKNKLASYSVNNKKGLIINDIKKDGYKYIKNYNEYFKYISLKSKEEYKPNSLIFVPMIIKGKIKGVLSIQCYEKNSFDLKDLITLKILSTYVAIALKNSFLYKRIKYKANYDSLTGVFNRHKVIENVKLLKQNINFNKENYYIAMIDLDNFKNVNDVYGHIIGDKVLREVAKTISTSIGSEDIIGRYGGEEFIAIIKDENNNYKKIIESIRYNIEALNINIDNKFIKVTSSIGVKKLNINKITLEENISLADKALYKAKNCGKNRIVY